MPESVQNQRKQVLLSTLLIVNCGLALLSCKDKEEQEAKPKQATSTPVTVQGEPSPVPPVEADTSRENDRAYFVSGGQLMEAHPEGSPRPLASLSLTQSCLLDVPSKSLWLQGRGKLFLFELDSQTLTPLIESRKLDTLDLHIRFGDGRGSLATTRPGEAEVAAVLMATKHPELRAEVVCEEENLGACYEGPLGDDPEFWQLRPEINDRLKTYRDLVLDNSKVVAKVAARRPAPAPTVSEEDRHVATLPKAPCSYRPADCGKGTALGSGFFSVIVENDRGDYFSEVRSLYREDAESFIDPTTGAQAEDLDAADISDAVISPDGSSLLTLDGVWFSLKTGEPIANFKNATVCGLVSAATTAESEP